jgi:hypothetical protein
MDPITLILLLAVAYLLYSSGALAKFGLSNPMLPSAVPNPPAIIIPATVNPPAIAAQGVAVTAAVTQTGNAIYKAFGCNQAGQSGSPICEGIQIGTAIFSVLSSVFFSASAARAKAAKAENSAVAAALPGWDNAITAIATAFNAGGLTASQAQTLFAAQLTNYWTEVTPQIQKGRNGCNGGTSCPGVPNPGSSQVTNEGGNNYCSGSIGAACCVGCADLNLSTSNLNWAVAYVEKTGLPMNAFVQVVFASKYGGVDRPAYNINFVPTPGD